MVGVVETEEKAEKAEKAADEGSAELVGLAHFNKLDLDWLGFIAWN